MKTIELTKGKVAVVDDCDFEFLNQWKWTASESKRKRVSNGWYAYRKQNKKSIYMHREIGKRMGFTGKFITDHQDCDGLNNRRENLRSCSFIQNVANRRKETGTISRFKGVSFHKRDRLWRARISEKAVGYFKSELAAARAYDIAAKQAFGEYARGNGLVP